MGTVLSYCTGASEENRVKLDKAEKENEDLRQQLMESQEKYSKLKQKRDHEDRKKLDTLHNEKAKVTADLLIREQEQTKLLNKYQNKTKRISVIENKAVKLAAENERLRKELNKMHKSASITEESNTISDRESTDKESIHNEELNEDIQQEEKSDENITPRTDMVKLRNWLVYKDLKEKQLKTKLAELLSARNESHRSKIPSAYTERYGANIMDDIGKIIKKTSNVYELADGLFKTRAAFDAQCIREIIQSKNNKIGAIEVGAIICCRNINELQLISHEYKRLYNVDMKDKIYKMSKGKTYQNIINTLFAFTRNDNETRNKYKIAAKVQGDVEYLQDKNIKWKNFDQKKKLAQMIVDNNINYVHDLNDKYFKATDDNFTGFVETQLGERSTSAQLMIMRIEFAADINDFYARKIQIHGDDGWKKTKEINRIFVSTFDNELKKIQRKFNQLNYGNGKNMIQWVNKQCKNEKYAFFLTKMLENCQKRS